MPRELIPTTRPVQGNDLDLVRQEFGLLTQDACFLFGLSITKWTQIVRKTPYKPLTDPAMALLVRLLADRPDLNALPRYPTAEDVFNLVHGIKEEIDQKRFSLMFGYEASAAYRWLKPNAKLMPTNQRLMYYIQTALQREHPEDRERFLDVWKKTVEAEAATRGVANIWQAGAWTPKEPKPPRKRARKPVVADGTTPAPVKRARKPAVKAPVAAEAAPAKKVTRVRKAAAAA